MCGPLTGIKVVELANFVAAPVTARLMADMGAEVVKIEVPKGDPWRGTGLSFCTNRFSWEENPVFDLYNTGKKLVSLNLKTPEGLEVFHKLLSEADVFVTNTRPAALKRLGLSYDDLKEKYPGLIYASVLGFGEEGPDAEKPAFDTTAFWSRTGFLRDMAVVNENYNPVSAPPCIGDTATGFLLLAEISTALYNRTRTGKGDYVRSTLYHNSIFCMGTMAIITQPPFGRKYPRTREMVGAPEGSYQCADGDWIYIATGNGPKNLPIFHRIIGHPELDEDPRFNNVKGRVANMEKYYRYYRDAILQKTAAEWLKIGEENDVPIVRMNHFSDLSKDEQAWANGFLEHKTYPNGNVDVVPVSPIEMNSVAAPTTNLVPAVGTHTSEILKSLGYDETEINSMMESGAVAGK